MTRSLSCEPAIPVATVRMQASVAANPMDVRQDGARLVSQGNRPTPRRGSMVSESMDESDYTKAERQAQQMVQESGPSEVMQAFIEFLLSAYSRKVCVISGRRSND